MLEDGRMRFPDPELAGFYDDRKEGEHFVFIEDVLCKCLRYGICDDAELQAHGSELLQRLSQIWSGTVFHADVIVCERKTLGNKLELIRRDVVFAKDIVSPDFNRRKFPEGRFSLVLVGFLIGVDSVEEFLIIKSDIDADFRESLLNEAGIEKGPLCTALLLYQCSAYVKQYCIYHPEILEQQSTKTFALNSILNEAGLFVK